MVKFIQFNLNKTYVEATEQKKPQMEWPFGTAVKTQLGMLTSHTEKPKSEPWLSCLILLTLQESGDDSEVG